MATQMRPRVATEDRVNSPDGSPRVSRDELIALLNDDLAREYQAVIAYVVYSQTLKGAAYMSIAQELEKHASEELSHALIIAKQIDYLGGPPTAIPHPIHKTEDSQTMVQCGLEKGHRSLRSYPDRRRPSGRCRES